MMKSNTKHMVKIGTLLVGLAFAASAMAALPAPPPPQTTVKYNGINYTISSQFTNYPANTALLTSQLWWGNQSLANTFAELVQSGAGKSAGFAYATSPVGVKMMLFGGSIVQDSTVVGLAGNWPFAYLISAVPDVNLAQLTPSLTSSAVALDTTMASTNTLIHGAHSRPLSRRVEVGENTTWIAGDWGRDDHGNREGSLGVAEIGVGRNFGPAQINVSVGKTWANQSLASGGDSSADGQYLMVEGIIPVSEAHKLFATVGGYGQWGDVDIRRGYVASSGAKEVSSASPDTRTWGVRARLDWDNAVAVRSMELSPYVDLSYHHSHMDAYTETGGSLPAQFDSRNEHSTELRAGFNGEMPLASTGMQLVANLEAAHRFNNKGATTSGQVNGQFTFSLPGQDYQSTWLKGGAGVEGVLGKGKASLMLNGTSMSGMPNAWLAASYQLAF